MTQDKKSYIWTPIPLDHLLSSYQLYSLRIWIPLGIWILSIAATLASTIFLLPNPELIFEGQRTEVINFFLFNPAYIIGLLLFFWFGFEWGFIPVFLSTFIIAFQSSMAWGWALIFAFSFVLGITIFALAYQSFKIPFDLRSLKSIAFYISISFIASIASSLGSFIWNLSHSLTALDTLTLWNGWWSGSFLQAVLFIGPLLFFLTPAVEYLKHRFLAVPQPPPISAKWIYGSVVSITSILVIFILSGKILGELRVEEVITASQHITLGSVLGALDSFEIISWISISLIILTGYGAIHIFSGWNRSLNEEVEKRTAELNESQQQLQESLNEKEFLLKEIHHRVKNNLALVSALLELQEMTSNGNKPEERELFQTSRARIKSMALAHEALYQTENFSSISMKQFVRRIADLTHKSFAPRDGSITLEYSLCDANLCMKRSIALGLLLNEVLINAYKHAFKGQKSGAINIESKRTGDGVTLSISDDGVGMPEHPSTMKTNSLGMKLIRKLAKQLSADLDILSNEYGTTFTLNFQMEQEAVKVPA